MLAQTTLGRHMYDIACYGVLFTLFNSQLRGRLNNARRVVPRTGQHPWFHPGWKILSAGSGYCSNTQWSSHFWCDENNDSFMHVWPHDYRLRQVNPCHWLGEVARLSSWATELQQWPEQRRQSVRTCNRLVYALMDCIAVCNTFLHPRSLVSFSCYTW